MLFTISDLSAFKKQLLIFQTGFVEWALGNQSFHLLCQFGPHGVEFLVELIVGEG